MISKLTILTAAISLLVIGASSAAPSGGLAGLEQLQPGIGQRASSSAVDWEVSNDDARTIPPGETLEIANLEGPGVIHHIWCTIASREQFYPRLMLVRMYWDGEEHPSVEAPIGDFFGVGHGLNIPFQSAPAAASSTGNARNCYWPMPFRKSARITVTNEGDLPVDRLYWYVDWTKKPRLPKNTAYFHAMYRQEFPTKAGKRYLIADIDGRGHYVGTVLCVRQRLENWFGEGDDFFYIDGEEIPSLRGTGSEDYFCDAWGFREFAYPYYGVPLFEGFDVGDRTSVYRWHIQDPVRFTESLRVEIEHVGPSIGEDGQRTGYGERPDDFSSVAFWYQEEPHTPWPAIPKGHDRMYPPEVAADAFEGDYGEEFRARFLKSLVSKVLSDETQVRQDTSIFTQANLSLNIENPTSAEMHVEPLPTAQTPQGLALKLEQGTVPPHGSAEVKLRIDTTQPVPLTQASLLPLDWRITFAHPELGDVVFTVPYTIVVEGPFAAAQVSAPPVVDGDLSEWDLPLAVMSPVQILPGKRAWDGPEDSQFRFGAATRGGYLYIGVEVLDDDLFLAPAELPWGQDGLEIRVTGNLDAKTLQDGADVVAIALNAVEKTAGAETADECRIWSPRELPQGTQAAVTYENGDQVRFQYEAAIPLTALGKNPANLEKIRLNVAVNDRDEGDAHVSQLWWRPDWRSPESYSSSGIFELR